LTKLVLDVDTGTDDAIAIMLAALDPRLELVAVTTVAGNASIDHTTENTLRVLDHIGAGVPVYRGAPGPLLPSATVRDHADAGRRIHGDHLDLPPATSHAPAIPDSAPVHDALCVAHLIDPDVIATREAHVDVELRGELTRGRTVVDLRPIPLSPPNARWAYGADRGRFLDLLVDAFA
jgi:inosine-uridine nucleoside N-ribohydrolase